MKGEWEDHAGSCDDFAVPGPPPSLRDFAILRAGEMVAILISTEVVVARVGTGPPRAISEGTTYFVSFWLRWSAPFVGYSEAQISPFRVRWQRLGELILDEPWTDWVPIEVPVIGSVEKCR